MSTKLSEQIAQSRDKSPAQPPPDQRIIALVKEYTRSGRLSESDLRALDVAAHQTNTTLERLDEIVSAIRTVRDIEAKAKSLPDLRELLADATKTAEEYDAGTAERYQAARAKWEAAKNSGKSVQHGGVVVFVANDNAVEEAEREMTAVDQSRDEKSAKFWSPVRKLAVKIEEIEVAMNPLDKLKRDYAAYLD